MDGCPEIQLVVMNSDYLQHLHMWNSPRELPLLVGTKGPSFDLSVTDLMWVSLSDNTLGILRISSFDSSLDYFHDGNVPRLQPSSTII